MTSRDLWLAALRMEPVERLPFWPKLDPAYPLAQDAPFRDMTIAQLHEFAGSDPQEFVGPCVREVREATSLHETRENGVIRQEFRTPSGVMTASRRFDPASQSWHPTEFPVRTVRDLPAMTEWFEDARWELDGGLLDSAKRACREIGDRGPIGHTLGESPLMYFVEWLAGIQNAHFLLADHRTEVERLFDAMHRWLLSRATLLAEHCPADMVYLSENTSTTLISPEQYRRYCVPHIHDYARVLEGSGKLLVLHMCGHLRDILPDLSALPVAGFEAFTSPPVGNVALPLGRSACPDKCLIGGTNATLWLRPAAEIIGEIKAHLDALPHHRGVVVTSGGVMPPACKPETIREVCDWVKAYPARV